MLGRHIYEEMQRDIQHLGVIYTTELNTNLTSTTSPYKAVQIAHKVANRYSSEYTPLVFDRLRDIGTNAVQYYAPEYDELAVEAEVSNAMDELVHTKYYGLTLPQRLKQSHLNLRSIIKRSSVVGKDSSTRIQNISKAWLDPVPFGAQVNWDKRLFLAEAVRLEHVVAKSIAYKKALRLMKWNLSGYHSKDDVCNKLATAVQPKVARFIKSHKFDLDPTGVYFLDATPPIPHPNCQCTLDFAYRTPSGKAIKPKKQLNLVQRILKTLFGT